MTAANVAELPEPKKPKKKPSVEAREAEAKDDGYVTVEHCGITLRVGVGDKMPAGVVDAYIDGDATPDTNWRALREWVGDEQWSKLKAAGMTRGDVMELDRKLGELSGN